MAWLPRFRQRTNNPAQPAPFGYAVVGLGHIAEFFLEALRDSPLCSVTAVVSGSAEKAARAAAKYGAARALTYGDFHLLADDPRVHAVYLALPVDQHRDFTARTAAMGKHVLCEKPMAATVEQARAMIADCDAAGVHLSVAYRCPYTSIHQRARELVRSGALGSKASLRIESGFGFPLKPGWRDDPVQAGGGSLFDVGVYPVNAARFLLEENPTDVVDAQAVCDGNGLEREIAWTSAFASGARLHGRSSYQTLIRDTLRVTGERGSLLLDPAFSHRERLQMHAEYRDASGKLLCLKEETPRRTASQFRMEAEDLAFAVREGRPLTTPGADGLEDMIAMQSIYRRAGVPGF